MPPISTTAIANTGTFHDHENPHDCRYSANTTAAPITAARLRYSICQKEQVRVIIDLAQSHDLAMKGGIFKTWPLHARTHHARSSIPIAIGKPSSLFAL